MGGMAVGALAASRLSGRAIAPLVAYAVIEALLGVAALIFHPLFDAVTTFAYETLLPASDGIDRGARAAVAACLRVDSAAVDPARDDVSR